MILPIVLSATYAVEFIVTSSTDDYRYFSLIIIKNACIFHIHSIWLNVELSCINYFWKNKRQNTVKPKIANVNPIDIDTIHFMWTQFVYRSMYMWEWESWFYWVFWNISYLYILLCLLFSFKFVTCFNFGLNFEWKFSFTNIYNDQFHFLSFWYRFNKNVFHVKWILLFFFSSLHFCFTSIERCVYIVVMTFSLIKQSHWWQITFNLFFTKL